MISQRDHSLLPLSAGSHVRVRQSHRSPYAGRCGTINSIDASDSKGPFLVCFEDGTQFRYRNHEIEPAQQRPAQNRNRRNYFLGKIMRDHFQMLFVLAIVSVTLIVSGCGPGPNPKLQGKAEAQEQQQSPAPAATPAAEPATPVPAPAPVRERPAPVAKPKQERPVTQPPAKPAPAPAPTNTTPAAAPGPNTASAAPGTVSLPAPTAPPVAAPVPPADEVKPQPVEPPPPRKISVPSGTLVAIRMIDSVDSETAHAGETFKASLDQPILVDNETVFPKGSDVYVKLAKVQAAGRVSGHSEIQLQLDRIFLGKTAYAVESNPYVSTGTGQGGKTARSAGIGAAIGAAIGAIAGGGKGAAIGGATGAGAGAGVEAVRKGEQVRVDSETRLDFRLENSLDVTLESPSTTTDNSRRNNPSDRPRFGTRQR